MARCRRQQQAWQRLLWRSGTAAAIGAWMLGCQPGARRLLWLCVVGIEATGRMCKNPPHTFPEIHLSPALDIQSTSGSRVLIAKPRGEQSTPRVDAFLDHSALIAEAMNFCAFQVARQCASGRGQGGKSKTTIRCAASDSTGLPHPRWTGIELKLCITFMAGAALLLLPTAHVLLAQVIRCCPRLWTLPSTVHPSIA